jgi:hypothetical protein
VAGPLRAAFRGSAEEALDKLARGIEPQLIVILSDIKAQLHRLELPAVPEDG